MKSRREVSAPFTRKKLRTPVKLYSPPNAKAKKVTAAEVSTPAAQPSTDTVEASNVTNVINILTQMQVSAKQDKEEMKAAIARVAENNSNAISALSNQVAAVEKISTTNATSGVPAPENLSAAANASTPERAATTGGSENTPTSVRGSIFSHSPAPVVNTATHMVSQNQVIVALKKYELAESDRIQNLTLRSYLFNKERYDEAKSQYKDDTSLTLSRTIGQQVIRELINNERMIQSDISKMPNFDVNQFYTLQDDIIIGMIASKLKPISPKDFGDKIFAAVKGICKSKIKGWTFQIKDYHNALYASLNELFFSLEEAYKVLNLKRDRKDDELKVYPDMEYGKVNAPGIYRYFLHCLHAFQLPFIQALPNQEKSLKEKMTVEEFFKLIRETNDKLARLSRALELQEQRLVIPATLESTFPQYEVNGEPQGPSHSRHVSEHRSLKLVEDSVVIDDRQQYRGDMYGEVEDDDAVELFFNDVHKSQRAPYHRDANHIKPEPKLYPDKPRDRVSPCFSWVNTGKCSLGAACAWSHVDSVCSDHVDKQLRQLSESPFLDSRIKEAVLSVYPPAHANAKPTQVRSVQFKSPISSNYRGRVSIVDSENDQRSDDKVVMLSEAKSGSNA